MHTNPESPDDNTNRVKSLERTFQIIECIEERKVAGVTEIADAIGVAKSTVHDHLKTLEANSFLVQDDGGQYRVGLRFLDHGGRARNRLQVYQTAKPEIEKLADETGELVNLIVEENGLGVYIHFAKGEDAVNLDTYIGKREHLHSTAFGKAILANLPPDRADAILKKHGLPPETDRTITARDALEERLNTVQAKGYAIDDEERLKGTCCVAAPITSNENEVVAAISVSGPAGRLKPGRLTNELADEVQQTVNIIEINMTYS